SRQRPNLTLTLPPGSDNPQFQTDAITLTVSPQAGRLNRNANLLLQVTRPLARTGNVNSRLVNQLLNRLRG
ncbi:MAG TPA: hypothetical protein VF590_20535, partial [Isosphaeraceae bacterium]